MKRITLRIGILIIVAGLIIPVGGLQIARGQGKNTSQSYSISGTVTDSVGNPLSGVTVTAYPNSNSGDVRVSSVIAQHDLAGYYPIGLGEVNNQISITVEWGERTPGVVRFQFNNDPPIEVPMTGTQVSHTFRFDQVLQEGSNTLQVTAVAADGKTSAPRLYQLAGWSAELGWLEQIAASLPYLGSDKIEFKVYVPGDPIDMLGVDVWLPGKPTKLTPQAVGNIAGAKPMVGCPGKCQEATSKP